MKKIIVILIIIVLILAGAIYLFSSNNQQSVSITGQKVNYGGTPGISCIDYAEDGSCIQFVNILNNATYLVQVN